MSKQRKANQRGDISRHRILTAPTKGLDTNRTYKARIRNVSMEGKHVVIHWSIYGGGK